MAACSPIASTARLSAGALVAALSSQAVRRRGTSPMFSNASCDSVLAAPIGQRRADRLGRFVAGNVVAAEAAVAAERPAGHVIELPLRAVGRRHVRLQQPALVDLHRRGQPIGNAFLGVRRGQPLRERRAEPHRRQVLERLLFVGRQLAAGRVASGCQSAGTLSRNAAMSAAGSVTLAGRLAGRRRSPRSARGTNSASPSAGGSDSAT